MELFKHSCFCYQFSLLVVDVTFMYPICSYSLDELGDIQYWEVPTFAEDKQRRFSDAKQRFRLCVYGRNS